MTLQVQVSTGGAPDINASITIGPRLNGNRRLPVQYPYGSRILSDQSWQAVRHLISAPPQRGRPSSDARNCLDGILWVLFSGGRWADLDSDHPSPATCWRRASTWEEQGVLDAVLRNYFRSLSSEERFRWRLAFLRPVEVDERGNKRRRNAFWRRANKLFLIEDVRIRLLRNPTAQPSLSDQLNPVSLPTHALSGA